MKRKILVLLFVCAVAQPQVLVQGDDYLLDLHTGVSVQQTGLLIEQANSSFAFKAGLAYWMLPRWLLSGEMVLQGTVLPAAKGLQGDSLRPTQTGEFHAGARYLFLSRPQLQVDVGLGLNFINFNYWNESGGQGRRPMTEVAVATLLGMRWLVSSDFSIGLDLGYGLFGGSFNRNAGNLDVYQGKFWLLLPPKYVAAKLSFLSRDWNVLSINGALSRSWGGFSYQIELRRAAIGAMWILTHKLMFEATLLSSFTF